MLGKKDGWTKLGRIIAPDKNISWMRTFAGSSCARQVKDTLFEIYVTGRDDKNRSAIGRFKIDIREPQRILDITTEPILHYGEMGAFDENGVSYPCVVDSNGNTFMYYVGWVPTVLTPFQNHLGLAKKDVDGSFSRVSRAPILDRTNDDHLSTGSAYVLCENGRWKMWYTTFKRWGQSPTEHKHYYHIKYATSSDGVNWRRDNIVCIDFDGPEEFAIARPSVLKIRNLYHMWYSYRGLEYRIGYAWSNDGIQWTRRDDLMGLDLSHEGWDSKALCYPSVFHYGHKLYMLYNGNHYGQEGLGLAVRDL